MKSLQVYWAPAQFLFEVSGKDATDFLHRVTSQDIKNLQAGQKVPACFLTRQGKIIAALEIERHDQEIFTLSCLESQKDEIVKLIQDYIIIDDVSLKEKGIREIPEVDEATRIRKGWLRWNQDFDSSMNPYEAGLFDYFSLSKGCYIGQEVLQRLKTYAKGITTFRVARLFTESSPDFSSLSLFSPEKEEVGRITSFSKEVDENGRIWALARVHKKMLFRVSQKIYGKDGSLWNVFEEDDWDVPNE